jgi:hypothetical protein
MSKVKQTQTSRQPQTGLFYDQFYSKLAIVNENWLSSISLVAKALYLTSFSNRIITSYLSSHTFTRAVVAT